MPNWSASFSCDLKWNKLWADTYNFAYPVRWSNLASVATAIDFKHLKAQASLLGTFISDKTRHGGHASLSKMTPAFFVNVYPFEGKWFSMRAYVKKSFRMPTFNDLYYTDMGNAYLKPESALQYDAGFVLSKHFDHVFFRHVQMQADGYYNTVLDKIIAYPKGQQFRWTMLNLGKVHIKGVDVVAETTAGLSSSLALTARVQYTYQDARDVTNPNTSYYNDQIPYIPWHSGSAIVGLAYKNWDFNYSFIYAGERYNQQENIKYNYMPAWYTNDLSLSYLHRLRKGELKVLLEVNNVLSQDYDVILNYPMPKRNYGLTLTITI